MSRAMMMAGLLATWPVVAAAQAQFNPDYAGRVQANETDCRNGVADACRRLGGWYGTGSIQVLGVVDEAKSAQWYERGCALGDSLSCQAVAHARATMALAAQEAACGAGDAASCMTLAMVYFQGQEVARDLPRSIGFGDRACTLGAAHGCLFLGAMHERGTGVALDAAKAEAYFRRALALAPDDPDVLAHAAERGISQ